MIRKFALAMLVLGPWLTACRTAPTAAPEPVRTERHDRSEDQKGVANKPAARERSTGKPLVPPAPLPAERIVWPVHDPYSPEPHCVFGEPRYARHDPRTNVTRRYSAFSVYYDDEVLAPRWTAIKMSSAAADANGDIERERQFSTDPFLKANGFGYTTHEDYKNATGQSTWDRGHMIQFDDARGYGKQAGTDSFFTTNVCPQLAAHNQKGWLALEQLCTEFARDYGCVWIFTGPVYRGRLEPFLAGRRVPSPSAFYKIVARQGERGQVEALAFLLPHVAIERNVDMRQFLVRVDDVEEQVSIDFFYELPDGIEADVESSLASGLWPDL